MCLVEVKKSPRPVASCTMPAIPVCCADAIVSTFVKFAKDVAGIQDFGYARLWKWRGNWVTRVKLEEVLS
ncbi:hypothetical protein TorRG33x02_327250 [Trema orientale]|uniref:Uncharacterized protein n=1 Tax=Trema orientale TaxID=63057 RepID=A0A2P5BB54_TREOI|nr:hypothetical protein TorRG33x02_327250 [Trema orientale]